MSITHAKKATWLAKNKLRNMRIGGFWTKMRASFIVSFSFMLMARQISCIRSNSFSNISSAVHPTKPLLVLVHYVKRLKKFWWILLKVIPTVSRCDGWLCDYYGKPNKLEKCAYWFTGCQNAVPGSIRLNLIGDMSNGVCANHRANCQWLNWGGVFAHNSWL